MGYSAVRFAHSRAAGHYAHVILFFLFVLCVLVGDGGRDSVDVAEEDVDGFSFSEEASCLGMKYVKDR